MIGLLSFFPYEAENAQKTYRSLNFGNGNPGLMHLLMGNLNVLRSKKFDFGRGVFTNVYLSNMGNFLRLVLDDY
jgi:hypothetical protein